jgi:hypothetical protein
MYFSDNLILVVIVGYALWKLGRFTKQRNLYLISILVYVLGSLHLKNKVSLFLLLAFSCCYVFLCRSKYDKKVPSPSANENTEWLPFLVLVILAVHFAGSPLGHAYGRDVAYGVLFAHFLHQLLFVL